MTDWADKKAASLAAASMRIGFTHADTAAALREAEARGIRRAADMINAVRDRGEHRLRVERDAAYRALVWFNAYVRAGIFPCVPPEHAPAIDAARAFVRSNNHD